jgi:hypothetical protein
MGRAVGTSHGARKSASIEGDHDRMTRHTARDTKLRSPRIRVNINDDCRAEYSKRHG